MATPPAHLTLNNGVEMPALGFGVFQTAPQDPIDALLRAAPGVATAGQVREPLTPHACNFANPDAYPCRPLLPARRPRRPAVGTPRLRLRSSPIASPPPGVRCLHGTQHAPQPPRGWL